MNENLQTNELYNSTYRKISQSQPINREELLTKFNEESIKRAWEVFSGFIVKNYQFGKGTVIPSFGTFTFTNAEVNLEGTTNQFNRDKKQRKPVFVVSSDFVETIRPGIYTDKGIIYYQQKQNNSVSHVKVNYAELSISANLNKAEYVTLIDHLLRFIGDSIRNNSFKNKELPGLGALVLRNNVLAVKFNDSFSEKVKSQPQKLLETKKNVNLFMNVNNGSNANSNLTTEQGFQKSTLNIENSSRGKINLAKSLTNIRPKTTILTKVSQNGEKWLKENLDIELDKILLTESEKKNFDTTKFFNDIKPAKTSKKKKLIDVGLDFKVLETIYFNKAALLSEMKLKDKGNKRVLSNTDVADVFFKLHLSNELSSVKVKQIIEVYSQENYSVDYFEFIDNLIRDIKVILNYDEKNQTLQKTLNSESTLRPVSAVLPTVNKILSDGKKLKVDLNEVIKEIRTIKSVIYKFKEKYSIKLEQNISYAEFGNILREFDIAFPSEKIIKILVFLELNPNLFSLQNFILNLDRCKIIANEMTSEELNKGIHKIKDIVYSSGKSAEELFGNNEEISRENFTKVIKSHSKDSFMTELVIESVYFNITKMDRNMRMEEFRKSF